MAGVKDLQPSDEPESDDYLDETEVEDTPEVEDAPEVDDDEHDLDDDDDEADDDDDDIVDAEMVEVDATEFDDHVDYEIAEWSGQSRALLDSMLETEGIDHIWQGTTLSVRVADEAATDSLIEIVTQTASQGLDPDRARVVYEVGTWSAAMQTSLAEALGIAEVAFEWDENGDLVIYEDDEEEVEGILDAMPDPDDPDAVDTDGVDVQDVLSKLWGAVGTLAKRPTDSDAVLEAIDAANQIEHIGLPFGFESAIWRDIVGKTLALRAALDSDNEDDQLSDDELQDGCADLHRQLRAYI